MCIRDRLDVLVDLMGFLGAGKASLFMKAIKVVFSFKGNAQKCWELLDNLLSWSWASTSSQVVKVIFSNIKKFCRVFCTSKALYSLLSGFFLDTKFLFSVTLDKWYASSAHYSGSFLADTHYPKWNFICSYGYTRSGVMALSTGHLFYELRLLMEFSEISFALMLATLATY